VRIFDRIADPMRIALGAEYGTPEALLAAAKHLRHLGYRRLDAFTPFEVAGIEEVLAIRRTRIPLVTLIAGLVGVTVGYLVQWYCNSFDYPIDVGGRPLHPLPAYIPITFETMILFGALATFAALLFTSRLPEPWNPLLEVEGFRRATIDRYWIGVDARDPSFDPERTERELRATEPLRVVLVGGVAA
jgi:hypothetical protein